MLQFQPSGFGSQVLETSLGRMVYYQPVAVPAAPQRPLVFLHSLGGGSSAYEWSKVYPAFASEYAVIAPDLVGWGQSDHPPRDYQVNDYLTLITELLQGVAQAPAAVVASSLTAGISVHLAIQRPDLVQSLFLVSPSGYSDFGADYSRGLAAQLAGMPGIDRLIYTLGAANELAVRSFLEQFLFARRSRVSPEMVAAYLASAQQPKADYAALASLKGALCFDLARYIPQLEVPTAIVWGEESRFSSMAVGQRLAALNPKAIQRFEAIADAGVLPHLELPAVVTSQLWSWLHQTAA